MNLLVLFASKGGNTQKIAETIASDLKCESIQIRQGSSPVIDFSAYDLVFLGTGIYTARMNPDLEKYLNSLDFKGKKTNFSLFLTWGGGLRGMDIDVITKLRKVLQSKGQNVTEGYFKCYGGRSYVLMRRGHPNREDLEAAKVWAKKQAEQQ